MDTLLLRLPEIVIQLIAFAFALSLHEAAHGWVAERLGDPTARWLGRITLNPLRHIDPFGTVIFPLLLAVLGQPIIGWAKPVPFVTRNLRNPRRDPAFVALAGPASNFLVALGCAVVLGAMRMTIPAFSETWTAVKQGGAQAGPGILAPLIYFVYASTVMNLVLGVFNLIPLPPLDGSHLLAALLPTRLAWQYQRLYPVGMILLFLVIRYTQLLQYLLFPFLWSLDLLLNS